ncbi:MAG: F0F1 ATP synthase subunit delta [Candidatus Omnitrophota bacterium]|nr:F0F1 ATP synthase subunit delta [Candidatus Omnitrophota bacterium]
MLIWQLVIIQVVTFILIALFLKWLLHSHISRALKRLQHLNQENLEKEKALTEELERAKREAARKIEEGGLRAGELKEQARQEAEKNRTDIVDKARKEAKRLINEALRDCQAKKTDLTLEMQEKGIYLAVDMIKHIFTESGRESLHNQFIDELVSEIKGVEKDKMKTEGDKMTVISAYPLDSGQKKDLKEILTSKLKKDITLLEEIDKKIVAGLLIKSGGFVIDGSIRNKLKKILPVMRERAKNI